MRCFYILMCASVSVHVCFSAATCVRLWLCPKSFSLLFYVFTRISLCLYGCAHSSAVYIHLVCSVTLRIPFSITLTIHIHTSMHLLFVRPTHFFFGFSHWDSYICYTHMLESSFGLSFQTIHMCARIQSQMALLNCSAVWFRFIRIVCMCVCLFICVSEWASVCSTFRAPMYGCSTLTMYASDSVWTSQAKTVKHTNTYINTYTHTQISRSKNSHTSTNAMTWVQIIQLKV